MNTIGDSVDKCGHEEAATLDAINKLSKAFPYAAAMLAFVLIERELKRKLVRERCVKESDLHKFTLGRVEKELRVSIGTYSSLRNELMHSNLYLVGQAGRTEKERHDRNLKNLKEAKRLLRKAFKDHACGYLINEKGDGSLVFEPKNF